MSEEEYGMSGDEADALRELVEALSARSRKTRQTAAHHIAEIAEVAPEALLPFVEDLAVAVNSSDSQTRWESVRALTSIAAIDPDSAACAFESVEDALYDEDSGYLRQISFVYFTKLGITTTEWARKTWPLIDEALQCYHGDPEFDAMLEAMIDFAAKVPDDEVRKLIVNRMDFDAKNARGLLMRRACQIVEAACQA